MKRICVVTGTRAEYGILSELMKRLNQDPEVKLQIIATNMHLSPEFGLTVREIERDGLTVDRRVEMMLSSDTPVGTVKSMGLCSIGIADAFDQLKPDMVVILGDRYEMLAVASAALMFNIPIAHLHGGEITEGAVDDAIRNAITKLSSLHFAATEEYRNRIIDMGEPAHRVFNSGSLAAESIAQFQPMSRTELKDSLALKLADDYISMTFHPVTRQPGEAENQTRALLGALEQWLESCKDKQGIKVIISLPNSDAEGRTIASLLREWSNSHSDDVAAFTSLGRTRYFSLLAHAAAVVGNSSSGLLEAPSFHIPTLNIGDRQKGRARGNTVVEAEPTTDSIIAGLQKILSPEFRSFCRNEGHNPYYTPGTLECIHTELKKFKE